MVGEPITKPTVSGYMHRSKSTILEGEFATECHEGFLPKSAYCLTETLWGSTGRLLPLKEIVNVASFRPGPSVKEPRFSWENKN